jgi:hypothetical protein
MKAATKIKYSVFEAKFMPIVGYPVHTCYHRWSFFKANNLPTGAWKNPHMFINLWSSMRKLAVR